MLTADEVVTRYTREVWSAGKVDMVRELCADPVTRHEAGSVRQLSHDEQVARVAAVLARATPSFDNIIQASDGTFVTAVYQLALTLPPEEGSDAPRHKDGCGIEVFKVVDGRIAEVWNHPMMDGAWG